MDEVISFLVFIVIVGFSILGKIKSERKAAQEREQEPVEPGGVETIPEPLRRMLFGKNVPGFWEIHAVTRPGTTGGI